MAQRITVRMRCRTRRAVTGLAVQIGTSTASTSAVVIWSIRHAAQP